MTRESEPRSTSMTAPPAQSEYGIGEIRTVSGLQSRSIRTTNQMGRQVVTITNSPNDGSGNAVGSGEMMIPRQLQPPNRPPIYKTDASLSQLDENTGGSSNFLSQPLGINDVNMMGGGPRYEQLQMATDALALVAL